MYVFAKVIAGGGIFLMAAFGCFLPFLVGNIITGNVSVFAICTGFAGGVLLGAGLIHQLPEAAESFGDFPWAETICGLGYALTYMIESLAFHGGVEHKKDHIVAAVQANTMKKKTTLCIGDMDPAIVPDKSPKEDAISQTEKESLVENDVEGENEQTTAASGYGTFSEHEHETSESNDANSEDVQNKTKTPAPTFRKIKSVDLCHPDSHEHASFEHSDAHSHGAELGENCDDSHEHDIHVHNIEFHDESAITAFVLVLALSFHSIMAGLSLGLAEDWTEFSAVLLAIVSHKFITSFALGLRFLQQSQDGGKIPTQTIVIQTVFCLMSPFGILLGIFVNDAYATSESVFPAVCKALSAGCFLYVAIITITEATDRLPHKIKSFKFSSIFVGYIFMAYVKTLESD